MPVLVAHYFFSVLLLKTLHSPDIVLRRCVFKLILGTLNYSNTYSLSQENQKIILRVYKSITLD